jgi:hypothetical protein
MYEGSDKETIMQDTLVSAHDFFPWFNIRRTRWRPETATYTPENSILIDRVNVPVTITYAFVRRTHKNVARRLSVLLPMGIY